MHAVSKWAILRAYHTLSEVLYVTISKKDGKDQELIQSGTTPDPGYNMGKRQNHNMTPQKRAKSGSALSQ